MELELDLTNWNTHKFSISDIPNNGSTALDEGELPVFTNLTSIIANLLPTLALNRKVFELRIGISGFKGIFGCISYDVKQ